jgi:hypothetical protein
VLSFQKKKKKFFRDLTLFRGAAADAQLRRPTTLALAAGSLLC